MSTTQIDMFALRYGLSNSQAKKALRMRRKPNLSLVENPGRGAPVAKTGKKSGKKTAKK